MPWLFASYPSPLAASARELLGVKKQLESTSRSRRGANPEVVTLGLYGNPRRPEETTYIC